MGQPPLDWMYLLVAGPVKKVQKNRTRDMRKINHLQAKINHGEVFGRHGVSKYFRTKGHQGRSQLTSTGRYGAISTFVEASCICRQTKEFTWIAPTGVCQE
jgi:hypothetical protein